MGAPRRLRWFEPAALTGVLYREVTNYSSYWRSATFSATVEPTLYLLAFGFGLGTIVSSAAGYRYVDFVGTGTVATAVLFASAFPGIFGTLVKWKFQRTYDGILAAPVDTHELVTAEALWLAARSGIYGCAPLLVAIGFGLNASWGMLLVPLFGFITGFGWACFGVMVAAIVQSFDNTSYVVSAVITPTFLVAGTFFPIEELPEWAQFLANFNPLYHCVELMRHAAFGFEPADDLFHIGALVAFALLMWRLAVWRMRLRLVD